MSDHETTLRELAAGLLARGRMDAEEPYSYSASQRADIIRKSERNADACLAGADALRRGTCANCDHRFDWPDAIGCNNARGLGRDEVSPDDFCSEWAPRKDAPTEPTR